MRLLLVLPLVACSVSRPSTSPAEPEPDSAPSFVVHLKHHAVDVETIGGFHGPMAFGMTESGAHEHPWNGERCQDDEGCHPLRPGTTGLTQVHKIPAVGDATTLFDNHFGGALTYIVRAPETCWVGGAHPEVYAEAGCQVGDFEERLEELELGHVEETPWKDPAHHPLAAEPHPTPTVQPQRRVSTLHADPVRRASSRKVHTRAHKSCCKHCSKGQPCGNSCISRSKTCRSIGGCACW